MGVNSVHSDRRFPWLVLEGIVGCIPGVVDHVDGVDTQLAFALLLEACGDYYTRRYLLSQAMHEGMMGTAEHSPHVDVSSLELRRIHAS